MALMLEWKDKYKIGVDKVDEQHKQLFAFVDELIIACTDSSDVLKIRQSLDFLVNYTVNHFKDEEAVQQECGYPNYAAHKQMHEDFKGVVAKMVRRYDDRGVSSELSSDINRIVAQWLVNHIMREDKKIGDYIRSK